MATSTMLAHSRRLILQRATLRLRASSMMTTTTTTTTMTRVLPPASFSRIRYFSTKPEEEANENKTEEETVKKTEESFEETVKRMQSEGKSKGAPGKDADLSSPAADDLLRQVADGWSSFTEEVGKVWQQLLKSGERKDINKKIQHPEFRPEGEAPYTGPVEILVIDESEHLTAWERMQRRLTDAPIIQDLLSRTDEVLEKTGAKKVKKQVDHLSEDAREAWETSQNPWVYRVSSVYDTLTQETPEAVAVAEFRKLDPDFTLEDWRQDVVEHTLPQIMDWFLRGKINQLKPWLGEGVFKRIAAEITAREQDGVQIDTHVLGIMSSEILACEPDDVNKGSPIIVLHFMCQQINCVRKKKDGTILEGSEDDIRANSYIAAFQREYVEEAGELNWKIVDFRFNGAIAYL